MTRRTTREKQEQEALAYAHAYDRRWIVVGHVNVSSVDHGSHEDDHVAIVLLTHPVADVEDLALLVVHRPGCDFTFAREECFAAVFFDNDGELTSQRVQGGAR